MPSKIWFLNHFAYLPEDGPHTRHFCLGKYLSRKGYETTVFASNELHGTGRTIDTGKELYAEKQVKNVRFLYVKSHHYKKNDFHRILNIISCYFNMEKVCKREAKKNGPPDVIYASCLYPTTLMTGIRLAKKYGIKCISETRDIVPDGFSTKGTFRPDGLVAKIARRVMKRIYEKSDALVFTMSGGPGYISEMGWDTPHGGKIDPDRVFYINNGVDLEDFEENARNFVQPDPDLDNKELFKVVYFGAIRFFNNMSLFLDAARELKKLGRNDIKILMWGTGTKLDEMRQQLADEGLDNLVLKGYVEKKYIPAIAERGDLFIGTGNSSSVNRYGMSFNKLFDYLAAGKPILLPFEVKNSIVAANGAGVELADADGKRIAEEIIHFADMEKAEYDHYCEQSRSVSKQFGYDVLAAKVENVINLLNQH